MSESGSDIEGRLARLEQRDQRLAEVLELLARREAAPAAKSGRDWDAYAAVIASFIGLLALVVSAYTAYVQSKQLRAQVWPELRLWVSTVNPRYFATNDGTGPARVTAMRVTVGGTVVTSREAMAREAGFPDANSLQWSSLGSAVLSPGKEFAFVQPRDNEDSREHFLELLAKKHALGLTVCYCSVLDDCWVAHYGAGNGAGEGDCPIVAAERFTD